MTILAPLKSKVLYLNVTKSQNKITISLNNSNVYVFLDELFNIFFN